MSYDEKNLTIDAIPGAPRKIISEQKINLDPKIETESSCTENKVIIEPTFKTHTKNSKESKPKKSSTKNSNSSTKIYVVNSSGVHFGAVNNFNYCTEENKCKRAEDSIPRTDQINRVLSCKSVVNREHIDMIAMHLGLAWRDVGLQLGYSSGQLDHFYEDNKMLGNKEVVYQMLRDWIQDKAEKALLGDLATTLWYLGQKHIVQRLVTLL